MKKLFTFGIFLFFLVGIGNNVNATIQSAGTGIAGLDWTNPLSWYGGVVPTNTDDVQIVAGDSIIVSSAEVGCASLQVDGTILASNKLHVNGLVLINSTGTFDANASVSLYCLNITNKGRFWAKGYTISGTPRQVYLGVGFTVSGTTYTVTYPTGGDYTIINDGRFGDFRARAFANTVYGSGIAITYNVLANSITIRPSLPGVTPLAFNISQILPVTGQTSTNNFTLNINESIGLGKYSSNACFSLQNGDTFSGTRTCNIAVGDTVFIDGYMHSKGSTPAVNQGNMYYNVYGCLDLATYQKGNTNEIDLWSTSLAGNTSSLQINVGDGTLANAGTLVLGKTTSVKMGVTGQTVGIFPTAYSTVSFGFPIAAATITCSPTTIYQPTYNNLIINNPLGVTLPAASTVSGTLTLTSGTLTNSTNNITLGNGANIVKSGGSLSAAPSFGTSVNLTYGAAITNQIATTTANSTSVTLLNANTNIVAGATVTGTGISNGTTVSTVSGTSVTLSQNATVTVTGLLNFSYNTSITTGNELPSANILSNLTVNNAAGVTLGTSTTVNGTLTLNSGNIALGSNNLTTASISGGSSSSYVVTNGTGMLTVPTTSGVATLFPVGASATTSYDPVTITPATGTSTAVSVSATLSGTAASPGINYNAREWTVTPTLTSSSTLAFTPSVVDATVASMIANSPYFALIGQAAGGSTYTNSNCSYSNGTYSGTYSSFSSFVTGTNSNATALQSVNNNLLIYPANNSVVVRNAKVGDIVSVYGVSGSRVASSVVKGDNTTINLTQGVYIVKTGSTVQKVLVQ